MTPTGQPSARHYLTLNVSETVQDRHSYKLTNALLNSVISNDLNWLRQNSNDIERRATSLRQLSFLSYYAALPCEASLCVTPRPCLSCAHR